MYSVHYVPDGAGRARGWESGERMAASDVRRRANTRARLLDAVETLLPESGTTGLRIDDICGRAGFTRGAFYSNFASVDDVLFALYERKTERLLGRVAAAQVFPDAEMGAGELGAEAAVERFLRIVPADPHWYALRAAFALRVSADPAVADALHVHAEDLRRGLTPFVEDLAAFSGLELAVDPAEATRVIIAAHVGAVLQGVLVEEPERLRRNTVLSTLRGLAAPATMQPASIPTPEVPSRGGNAMESPVIYALTASPGGVHRIEPRTGAVERLAAISGEVPDGIVIDPEAREAVFTLMGAPDSAFEPGIEPPFTRRNGSVAAVPLAGGEPRTLVERGAFTTGKQLARDPGSGRLFWSDREGCGVYRSERDGSDVTLLVHTEGMTPAPAEDQCVGVAADPVGGFIYWTQKGPSKGGKGRILRAGLELPSGDSAEARSDIEVLWEGLPEPIDLELDLDSGVLFWTDRGAGPDGNTLNRAPIPARGERGASPEILARGFREAIGLAVDRRRGVAYVSDLGGSIHEIDIASGEDRVVAKFPGGVTGIALGDRRE